MSVCPPVGNLPLCAPRASRYSYDMATLFILLTVFFMAATLVTLGIGVVGMGKGGEFNKQNANKLMRLRVIFQGLAIASFLLWLLVR